MLLFLRILLSLVDQYNFKDFHIAEVCTGIVEI